MSILITIPHAPGNNLKDWFYSPSWIYALENIKPYDYTFACMFFMSRCAFCLHLACPFSYIHCKEETDKLELPNI